MGHRGRENPAMEKALVTPQTPAASPSAARWPSLQRKCACGGTPRPTGECEECRRKRLGLRRKGVGPQPAEVPPIVHEVLRSPGRPLEPSVCSAMERYFGAAAPRMAPSGPVNTVDDPAELEAEALARHPSSGPARHDFSRVRIHTDAQAARSAQAVDALAYTVGSHIVFDLGQYRPHSLEGRHLLAHELAHTLQQSAHPASVLQRQPRRDAPRRPLVQIDLDTRPARIDRSKGVDEITNQFYSIPPSLMPPNTPYPAGPILTLGPYGCGIRRYGLTTDEFSLCYSLSERDMRMSTRPFSLLNGYQTTEVWTEHVRFSLRLRQSILIPNNLATHPCLQGSNPVQQEREITAHERQHEADNREAAEETRRTLRERLAFTLGIGRLMATVRITRDPASFLSESTTRLQERLNAIAQEMDIFYHRQVAEKAITLDPHDQILHEQNQRLLEAARARNPQTYTCPTGGRP
jgi:hypothetical protein